MITHIYIGVTVFIILDVLMVKYLNGDFDYTDEIIDSGKVVDERGDIIGRFYDIKRTYKNGRIRIIKQKV